MDVEHKEVIDFTQLKKTLDERGMKSKFVADKLGIIPTNFSKFCRNAKFPLTDVIAQIAWTLKVPVSKIVSFTLTCDEKKKKWFEGKYLPYLPPDNAQGVLTYQPLWNFMDMYLDYLYQTTGKEKTANDVFDLIEPYRRRNHIKSGTDQDISKLSVEKRFGENYEAKTKKRKYVAKGLTPEVRTKLRNDRPLNIRTIYDICNFLGCPVDWVVSYK